MYPEKMFPAKNLNDINKRFSDEAPMEAYDGLIFIKQISETTGLKDKRDTNIENGDKAIISYYIHTFYSQITTIIGGIILLIYTYIYIYVRKSKIR